MSSVKKCPNCGRHAAEWPMAHRNNRACSQLCEQALEREETPHLSQKLAPKGTLDLEGPPPEFPPPPAPQPPDYSSLNLTTAEGLHDGQPEGEGEEPVASAMQAVYHGDGLRCPHGLGKGSLGDYVLCVNGSLLFKSPNGRGILTLRDLREAAVGPDLSS